MGNCAPSRARDYCKSAYAPATPRSRGLLEVAVQNGVFGIVSSPTGSTATTGSWHRESPRIHGSPRRSAVEEWLLDGDFSGCEMDASMPDSESWEAGAPRAPAPLLHASDRSQRGSVSRLPEVQKPTRGSLASSAFKRHDRLMEQADSSPAPRTRLPLTPHPSSGLKRLIDMAGHVSVDSEQSPFENRRARRRSQGRPCSGEKRQPPPAQKKKLLDVKTLARSPASWDTDDLSWDAQQSRDADQSWDAQQNHAPPEGSWRTRSMGSPAPKLTLKGSAAPHGRQLEFALADPPERRRLSSLKPLNVKNSSTLPGSLNAPANSVSIRNQGSWKLPSPGPRAEDDFRGRKQLPQLPIRKRV